MKFAEENIIWFFIGSILIASQMIGVVGVDWAIILASLPFVGLLLNRLFVIIYLAFSFVEKTYKLGGPTNMSAAKDPVLFFELMKDDIMFFYDLSEEEFAQLVESELKNG